MLDVTELITYPKEIQRKKALSFKKENRHFRADIPLNCELDNVSFTMFLRKMILMPENFTVGLRLDTPNPFLDSPIVLVRYQGPHGGQSNMVSASDLHNDYHIHLYSQTDLDRRRKLASNNKAKALFCSYEEAVTEFLRYCNVSDPHGIFEQEKAMVNQLAFDFPNETL